MKSAEKWLSVSVQHIISTSLRHWYLLHSKANRRSLPSKFPYRTIQFSNAEDTPTAVANGEALIEHLLKLKQCEIIHQADSRHHQQQRRPHRRAKKSISFTRPPAELSEVTTPNYHDTNDNKRSLHHPTRTGAIRDFLLRPPRQAHKPNNVRLPHRRRRTLQHRRPDTC